MADTNIMKELWKLKQLIESKPYLEQYNYFITHSEKGENCTYAQKAASLYLRSEHDELMKELTAQLEIVSAQAALLLGPKTDK